MQKCESYSIFWKEFFQFFYKRNVQNVLQLWSHCFLDSTYVVTKMEGDLQSKFFLLNVKLISD